ncbi:MAG: undecaprenyldiphospho-muramoylpentapeptide beta-N-acetylglucosaminyltransferase [Desulfobacterales bacterium]
MIHNPLNIVFAAGGTGGHLFPAIALAQEFLFRNSETRILFLGTGRPLEASVLSEHGFNFEKISAGGIKGRSLFRQVGAIVLLLRGIWQSEQILKSFKPHLVIGMGSYSSVPVVLAAWRRRIPVVLCEQNILPGIANRYLARLADRINVSFEHTLAKLPEKKVRFTGNPVRKEVLQSLHYQKGEKEPFTILILGGSQGAHAINMAVISALGAFKGNADFFFIHQTGETDESQVKSAYGENQIPCRVRAFFKDMVQVYQKADLVICRAGATTVAEISALGKPAVFIPFPYAADDHQVLNARVLCDAGASEMISEKDLTGEFLAEKIFGLAKNRLKLKKMARKAALMGRPDAAVYIVDDCYRLICEK